MEPAFTVRTRFRKSASARSHGPSCAWVARSVTSGRTRAVPQCRSKKRRDGFRRLNEILNAGGSPRVAGDRSTGSELKAEDRVPVLLELNAALTDRPGEYGNTLNLDGAYTPQLIVDGRFELDPNRSSASVRLTKGDCLCATD